MTTSRVRPFAATLAKLVQTKQSRCILVALLAATLALLSNTFIRTRAASNNRGEQMLNGRARASDHVSVLAARRGNPWISLGDGHDLLTSYSGRRDLIEVLERNQAQPLSLALADFDEDGVPDLIAGYAGPNGGIITLHRGNVDSIYPNTPEARQRRTDGNSTDAPFLAPAAVFGLSERADFIGVGDFDGDGHWDVAAGARGGSEIYLLSGDGRGGLRETKTIELPGGLTAMMTGDINRRDGLDDLIVGISGVNGPQVLVFEGPEGALRATPEAFDVPAAATSLAIGQLDDGYETDLAIAAGRELIIVHGRDRKLSLTETQRAEVPGALLSRRSFPTAIRSIASGSFGGRVGTADIAVLLDDGDIVVLSAPPGVKSKARRSVENWNTARLATGAWSETARLVTARVASTPGDSLIIVDQASRQVQIVAGTPKSGEVAASNAQPVGAALDLSSNAVAVLPMRLNADALSDLVILRANQPAPVVALTQPQAVFVVTNTSDSGPGSLRQALMDADANPGADSITFNIPGAGVPSIKPLSPLPAITDAITLDGSTQPGGKVELDGSSAGTSSTALGLVFTAGGSTVRGFVINRFDRSAIRLDAGDNVVEGCFIGTDSTGTAALPNGANVTNPSADRAIRVFSARNVFGGTAAAARNVLSGNAGTCIEISGPNGTSNLVQGNFIGTTVSGLAALGNARYGISLAFTTFQGTSGGATNNNIGGTTAGAGNVISGNGTEQEGLGGMLLLSLTQNPTSGNLVQGNLIGTNITGTAAVGNHSFGVAFAAPNNTLGGTTPSARNVISGNGIEAGFGAVDLSATSTGINSFVNASGTLIQGNVIGTAVDGKTAVGNVGEGVIMSFGAANCSVGGTTPGAGNIIAFNTQSGITLFAGPANSSAGAGNSILSNSIFSNGILGIDLGGDGVTLNHNGNTTGPNNFQNFPVISSVSLGATSAIHGALNSTPSTTFRIEFFSNSQTDASGFGEGETFIGFINVTTDGAGNANFTFANGLVAGQRITATATDATGNTSEFSRSVLLSAQTADVGITLTGAPEPVATGGRVAYTIRATNASPNAASDVNVTDALPANTTFSSATISQGSFASVITVGGQGLVFARFGTIPAGGSATVTITANVIAAAGLTITDSAMITTSLIDPNSANNAASAATDVRGGGIVFLTWEQPSPSPGNPTPAPTDLRAQAGTGSSMSSQSSISSMGDLHHGGPVSPRTAHFSPTDSVPCVLVRVNIYKSDSTPVLTIRDNLWISVAPSELQATMAAAPAGSFYVITNVWKCGDLEIESGGSNETGVPGGPTIDRLRVGGKIKAFGSSFTDPPQVFLNGIGFTKAAVFADSTLVIQKGTLTDGRSIPDATPPGTAVIISVRNSNGGISSSAFTAQ